MSDTFDLMKIKKLIEDKHPPAVIVADTNIVMREPEFKNWITALREPLFVLSDVIITELERIRNKPDCRERASKAIRSFNALLRSGRISEGIRLENIGWFVSVPSPLADNLKVELERLEAVVGAFGQSDTKLLLLAKELNQHFPYTPIVFATADRNLFNILELNNIRSYLLLDFPMSGIEKIVTEKALEPIDWDDVLGDIQKTTQDKSVEVELTLTAKQCLPKWVSHTTPTADREPLVVAEGYGVVRGLNTGTLRFLWSLPFKPIDWKLDTPESDIQLPVTQPDESTGASYVGTAHLDFLGDDNNIAVELTEALTEKISGCKSPVAYIEDMPTVQDPTSVMQMLLLFDYLGKQEDRGHRISNDTVKTLQEEIRNSEGLINFWGEWVLYRQDNDDDMHIILGELLMAMSSCWRIGDTRSCRIVLDI